MREVDLNRVEFYRKMVECYEMFRIECYNDGIRVLGTLLETIMYSCKTQFDNNRWVYAYYERVMNYRRPLRKSKKALMKQFNQFFHKSMEKISQNRFYQAYSYMFDMKDMLEKLKEIK